VYSYHVLRLRLATDWDLAFRAYAFKTNHFYRQAYRLCEGSGQRYVLNLSTFRDMTVRVPDLVTQRRIGKALATADRGIDRLKQLRDRYRGQKTGIAARFLSSGGATS